MLVAAGQQAHHHHKPLSVRTMIEFGHLSHPGLIRPLNEDTYHGDAALGLWLVADGMGGSGRGDVASAMARDAIVRQVRSGATLEAAIRQADTEIFAASRQRPGSGVLPMGTSVVCARRKGGHFHLAWAGDCRAYHWQGGRLTRVTADTDQPSTPSHRSPPATRAAERLAGARPSVNQALGVTDASHLTVASATVACQPGMQLLLCSDGLSEEITHAQMAVILSAQDCSAQETVDTLVAAALEAGGSDNITAILIRAL